MALAADTEAAQVAMCVVAVAERAGENVLREMTTTDDLVESIYEEAALLRQLVALADAMYAEHAAEVQAESDARYQAEFGHNGPSIASPLDSAGRKYVFYRHRLGRRVGLPDAAVALGQRRG